MREGEDELPFVGALGQALCTSPLGLLLPEIFPAEPGPVKMQLVNPLIAAGVSTIVWCKPCKLPYLCRKG